MSYRFILVSLFSVSIQIGLAVLGWGGFGAFFSHSALIALCIVTALLLIAAFFTNANLSSGEKEDRGNRWVLAAFSVLAILVAYLPAYTDRAGFLVIDGDRTRWLGIILFILGGALRLWPVFVLDKRFSGLVAIQREHTLVTTGIYSKIRNPSYLGLLVTTLGWALAFRSVVGVVLALIMLVPLIGRMRSEEKMLLSHFGSEYEAYCARTKRLIPLIY